MRHWTEAAPVCRLGLALLHSTWEGLGIAAVLWAALAATVRRSPGVRYGAACLALGAAVIAPIATFIVLSLPTSRPVPTAVVDPSPTLGMTPAGPIVPWLPTAEPHPPMTTATGPAWSSALPWLSAAWAVSVLVVGLWNGLGWLAVQRLRRRGVTPVGPELERVAGRLADRLGVRRAVRLLASVRVDSPLVVGLLRPLILLPASLLSELPGDQLEALLAHEVAHVRRHDYLVNLLQCGAETLLFYHPAVWWISRRIRVEREHCCDDVAVGLTGDRIRYVRALATVAEGRRSRLAPAARGTALLPRVRRVLGLPPEPARAPPRAIMAVAVAALVAGIVSVRIARSAPATAPANVPAADRVTVRGRVLDPNGRPVAGATVAVGFMQLWGEPGVVVDTVQSGPDGGFVVSAPRATSDAHELGLDAMSVAASAPGYGLAAMSLHYATSTDRVELKLVPDDVPIDGRLLDPQGRPVAGADVVVDSIEPFLRDLEQTDVAGNPRYLVVDGLVVLPTFAGHLSTRVTTGADGRFRITGAGRDRTVHLEATAPGFVPERVEVLTRPGPRVSKAVIMDVPGMHLVTYGAQFDLTLRPGRSVEGTVTDAATGQPIAGASVDPGWVKPTRTNRAGHYRLDGLGESTELTVVPPGDQPYLQRQIAVPDQPAARLDVPLHRGVWMSGRATEAGTGRPVVGWVYYAPLKTNPAADIPEFPKDRMNTNWPPEHPPYYSRPDGTFRVAVVPGPALIGIQFTDKPYRFGVGAETVHVRRTGNGHSDTVVAYFPESLNVVRQVDVPADGLGGVEFRLDPGATVRLTATDPAGRPLSGVLTHGLWAGDRGGPPQATATFDVKGLAPDEHRVVELTQPDRGLGLLTFVGPEQAKAGAITVQLLPLCKVTGRLLDVHGRAMADARVDVRVENPPGRYVETAGQPTGTDAAGRFTCTVPAGVQYRMAFTKGAAGTRDWWFTESEPCAVHAGQTTDIGDVRLRGRELYGP